MLICLYCMEVSHSVLVIFFMAAILPLPYLVKLMEIVNLRVNISHCSTDYLCVILILFVCCDIYIFEIFFIA